MKYLLVRTKVYWSWAGGPVLFVRTVCQPCTSKYLYKFALDDR